MLKPITIVLVFVGLLWFYSICFRIRLILLDCLINLYGRFLTLNVPMKWAQACYFVWNWTVSAYFLAIEQGIRQRAMTETSLDFPNRTNFSLWVYYLHCIVIDKNFSYPLGLQESIRRFKFSFLWTKLCFWQDWHYYLENHWLNPLLCFSNYFYYFLKSILCL